MNITRRDPFMLATWEPFREIEETLRRFSPFLWRGMREQEGVGAWRPLANISETDREYLIKVELPEVKKEDIEITVDNGMLTLRGERKFEREAGEASDLRVESLYGTFARSFALPEDVDTNKIEAECKDGILRIRIPKTETTKTKPITVKVQ
ncbi:MAG: Hsp20/alpha crystallin family protein [Gammaproteobacteria bacterium]|nr:heat-shock protein Hsp20 [Gammaproteobacteria bacterium]